MITLPRVRAAFERVLETVVILLMTSLAVVVLLAVVYRKAGASFSWYDEVASIQLAWLTYYGAALAALRRAHIGFDGLLRAMPPKLRVAAVLMAEAVVIGFFVVLAWTGVEVHYALEGDYLVSLPEVPVQLTKSVIPIGAVLFIAAQLMSLPEVLRAALTPRSPPGVPPPAGAASPEKPEG
ncbi:MAG: TRAP transporter small permease [Alphaproteobacteria bacterium]